MGKGGVGAVIGFAAGGGGGLVVWEGGVGSELRYGIAKGIQGAAIGYSLLSGSFDQV